MLSLEVAKIWWRNLFELMGSFSPERETKARSGVFQIYDFTGQSRELYQGLVSQQQRAEKYLGMNFSEILHGLKVDHKRGRDLSPAPAGGVDEIMATAEDPIRLQAERIVDAAVSEVQTGVDQELFEEENYFTIGVWHNGSLTKPRYFLNLHIVGANGIWMDSRKFPKEYKTYAEARKKLEEVHAFLKQNMIPIPMESEWLPRYGRELG